jgi:hypothetical protein
VHYGDINANANVDIDVSGGRSVERSRGGNSGGRGGGDVIIHTVSVPGDGDLERNMRQ